MPAPQLAGDLRYLLRQWQAMAGQSKLDLARMVRYTLAKFGRGTYQLHRRQSSHPLRGL